MKHKIPGMKSPIPPLGQSAGLMTVLVVAVWIDVASKKG